MGKESNNNKTISGLRIVELLIKPDFFFFFFFKDTVLGFTRKGEQITK